MGAPNTEPIEASTIQRSVGAFIFNVEFVIFNVCSNIGQEAVVLQPKDSN
jgi:hypothetical protein